MKTIKLFLIPLISLLFSNCNEYSWTYEIDPKTKDTINRTNEWGRQGRWIIKNCCAYNLPRPDKNNINDSLVIKQGTIALATTTMPNVREIGNYVNNKKQGLWTYYGPDETVNKTQEFKDDVPVRN